MLSKCPVPLPPLAEQRRIVAEVERRLSVIQQTEAAVVASLQRADRLRQSILKRAFAGELVPQDPDDEPASVLLERIRAQREAEQAAASAGKKRPARRRRTKASQQLTLEEATRMTTAASIGQKLLELLRRAAQRRPVLRRLPGAAHLPHLPQDDARAHPAALHHAARLPAAAHSRGLRLAQPAGTRRRRSWSPTTGARWKRCRGSRARWGSSSARRRAASRNRPC